MSHLMIGLGGTGGKVLAAFRKSVFQQFNSADTDQLALDYLYIDSDARDIETASNTTLLEDSDRTWRVLGHLVQLAPAQLLHLRPGDLDQIVRNVEEFPTLKRWIGDRATWDEIRAGSPNGITAAGQLRRFGRLLFAQNVTDVRQAITQRLSVRRGQAVAADWTFHVVAGLAGGTGSGTLLDLLALIREIPQGAAGKVVCYCVLPEPQETSWATHNYYANGYAALAELNALIVDRLRLSNVAESAGVYSHAKLVDNVFVVTNVNDQGVQIDMAHMVPSLVAETMYQIIVSSGEARTLEDQTQRVGGNDQRQWRQMVTGENYMGQYESDPGGPPSRANRFLSFGLKRIAIPTEEIRDYASGTFVRQFLLQIAYNNWVDAQGFVDSDRPFDATSEARKAENQNEWGLTFEHAKLERKMLVNDSANWTALRAHLHGPINGKRTALQEGSNSDTWIGELDAFARTFFDSGFRQVGVAEFYQVQERTINDRARYIARDRVATSLFEKWKAGSLSAREVERVVAELIVDVQEKLAKCDKQVDLATSAEKDFEATRSKLAVAYHDRGKFNPLNLLKGRKDRLAIYGETLADLYGARANKTALAFARRLYGAVLTELDVLRKTTETVVTRMAGALKRTELEIAERVQVDGQANADPHTTKLYDAPHVRAVLDRLQQDATLQRDVTSALRQALVAATGPNPGFTQMVETISEGRLIAVVEALAQKRVDTVLARQESERDRILETSIVRKLFEQYDGREADLRAFIGNQVRQAGTFAPQDPNERISHNAPPVASVMVAFVPAARDLPDDLRQFHGLLCRVIAGAAAGRNVEVVETSSNQQEIVFLGLVNQFALRQLSLLKFLKSRYDRMLIGPDGKPTRDAARKRLELHLEGDGRDLPSLFARGIEETRRELRPYFLIAQLEELLRERRNATTGAPEVRIIIADENGALMPVVVGTSLERGTTDIGIAAAISLQQHVEAHLAKLVHVDARKALLAKLAAHQNAVMEANDFDQSNKKVMAVVEDVQAARALLPA